MVKLRSRVRRERGFGLGSLGWVPLAALLAACATTPEPKIVTQIVKVPVVQACLTKDLNLDPQFPDSDAALRASGGAGDMLQLLAAGRLLRIQTMAEWKAALIACR